LRNLVIKIKQSKQAKERFNAETLKYTCVSNILKYHQEYFCSIASKENINLMKCIRKTQHNILNTNIEYQLKANGLLFSASTLRLLLLSEAIDSHPSGRQPNYQLLCSFICLLIDSDVESYEFPTHWDDYNKEQQDRAVWQKLAHEGNQLIKLTGPEETYIQVDRDVVFSCIGQLKNLRYLHMPSLILQDDNLIMMSSSLPNLW